MKSFKKFMVLVLSLIILLSSITCIYAADTEFMTFSMNDPRWGNEPCGNAGYNIGESGCLVTSVAILMGYANSDLRDVNIHNPKTVADAVDFPGGLFDWNTVSNYDSTFTFYGKVLTQLETDETFLKSIIKNELTRGRYVVIYSANIFDEHWCPIVGMEGDVPLVYDPADNTYGEWSDWFNAGISCVASFEGREPSTDTLGKIEDTSGGNGGSQGGESSEDSSTGITFQESIVPDEKDLVGMEDSYTTYKDNQVALPEEEDLSITDQKTVEAIRLGITEGRFSVASVLGTSITVVGLAFITYGMALLLAYLFDLSNQFVEVSLLSIITLGKYRLIEDSDKSMKQGWDKNERVTYVTKGMIITRVGIMIFIGIALLSGIFQELIYYLYIHIFS